MVVVEALYSTVIYGALYCMVLIIRHCRVWVFVHYIIHHMGGGVLTEGTTQDYTERRKCKYKKSPVCDPSSILS